MYAFCTSALKREDMCPPLSFNYWHWDGKSSNNSLDPEMEAAYEDGRALLLVLDLSILGCYVRKPLDFRIVQLHF